MWDVAARYSGEHHGFKTAVAAAYSEMTDENLATPPLGAQNSKFFQIGAYVEHVHSGLWVYGAYGREDNDRIGQEALFPTDTDPDPFFPATDNPFFGPNSILAGLTNRLVSFDSFGVAADDGEMYYLKAGIRRRWHPLGHTVLFGLYSKRDDMYNGQALATNTSDADNGIPFLSCIGVGPAFLTCDGTASTQIITGSESREYGVGIVQEIDAAAMSLWLVWKRFEGSYTGVQADWECGGFPGSCDIVDVFGFKQDLDDMDLIKFGALINF